MAHTCVLVTFSVLSSKAKKMCLVSYCKIRARTYLYKKGKVRKNYIIDHFHFIEIAFHCFLSMENA